MEPACGYHENAADSACFTRWSLAGTRLQYRMRYGMPQAHRFVSRMTTITPFMPKSRRIIAVLMLATLIAAMPVRVAASSSACKPFDTPDTSLPDARTCIVRHGIAAVAAAPDPSVFAPQLFSLAENQLAAGRVDAAEHALDCAAAVLADADGAKESKVSKVSKVSLRYQLIRRRGLLEYNREHVPEALRHFECALELSSTGGDRTAIAKDLKNIGSALRRLGDFRGALKHLTESLRLQRVSGQTALGPVLNNLGDVYREIGESGTALSYYQQAFEDFRGRGQSVEAAHVLETMSVLALDRGDNKRAQDLLETALKDYQGAGYRAYQLHIYTGLIRLALAEGEIAKARQWRAASLAMAAEYDLSLPAMLELQIARTDLAAGNFAQAQTRLRVALDRTPLTDTDRPALLQTLASGLESSGDLRAALAAVREAQAAESRLAEARHDRELGWARSRFEATERERKIAALEKDNSLRAAALRQRTLMLWLVAASALAALSLLSLFFLRRHQRARLLEAARQARQEEEIAQYRRQTAALDVDRRLLKALFDDRAEAVCVIDAEGTTLTANRHACEWLAIGEEQLLGREFVACLHADDHSAFDAALERMEDADQMRLTLRGKESGVALSIRMFEWAQNGGLILVFLEPVYSSLSDEAAAEPAPAGPIVLVQGSLSPQEDFRRALVELMLASIENWEHASGTTRLELAERSRIWRVAADDGRVRARSMERYLSLSRMPQNPRWRDVLRTGYYVLTHCELDANKRDGLQARVDAVSMHIKRRACV
jgi:two-component system, sensor histidine kinase ChiS